MSEEHLHLHQNGQGQVIIEVTENSRARNWRIKIDRPVGSTETLGDAIEDAEKKVDALVGRMESKYGRERLITDSAPVVPKASKTPAQAEARLSEIAKEFDS